MRGDKTGYNPLTGPYPCTQQSLKAPSAIRQAPQNLISIMFGHLSRAESCRTRSADAGTKDLALWHDGR